MAPFRITFRRQEFKPSYCRYQRGVGQDCLRHCVSWFATVCIPFTLLIDSSHHFTTCFIGLQECVGSSTMTIRQVTAPQSGASKDFSRQYGVDCLLPVATCRFVYRL